MNEDQVEKFIYEGENELKEARLKITQYSLKQAALRIERSRVKKETIDPLEEEEAIDKDLAEIPKFESSMCQFADDSCVSKGAFSPDSTEFVTAGWSGVCKLWNVKDTSLKCQLLGHTNRAIDVQFHPKYGTENKLMISSGADNMIRLWNLTDE